jgi:hypothetical protein
MTRLELIQLIGDDLTRIDVLRGGLLPSDPQRRRLDDIRLLLDDRQRQLSKQQFDESTIEFRKAASDITRINQQVKATIDNIERLVTTLDNLGRLMSAVDTILGLAIPLV